MVLHGKIEVANSFMGVLFLLLCVAHQVHSGRRGGSAMRTSGNFAMKGGNRAGNDEDLLLGESFPEGAMVRGQKDTSMAESCTAQSRLLAAGVSKDVVDAAFSHQALRCTENVEGDVLLQLSTPPGNCQCTQERRLIQHLLADQSQALELRRQQETRQDMQMEHHILTEQAEASSLTIDMAQPDRASQWQTAETQRQAHLMQRLLAPEGPSGGQDPSASGTSSIQVHELGEMLDKEEFDFGDTKGSPERSKRYLHRCVALLERAHVAHLEKGNAGYKADAAMAIGESDEPSKFVDSEQKAFLHGYNLGNLGRQETAASMLHAMKRKRNLRQKLRQNSTSSTGNSASSVPSDDDLPPRTPKEPKPFSSSSHQSPGKHGLYAPTVFGDAYLSIKEGVSPQYVHLAEKFISFLESKSVPCASSDKVCQADGGSRTWSYHVLDGFPTTLGTAPYSMSKDGTILTWLHKQSGSENYQEEKGLFKEFRDKYVNKSNFCALTYERHRAQKLGGCGFVPSEKLDATSLMTACNGYDVDPLWEIRPEFSPTAFQWYKPGYYEFVRGASKVLEAVMNVIFKICNYFANFACPHKNETVSEYHVTDSCCSVDSRPYAQCLVLSIADKDLRAAPEGGREINDPSKDCGQNLPNKDTCASAEDCKIPGCKGYQSRHPTKVCYKCDNPYAGDYGAVFSLKGYYKKTFKPEIIDTALQGNKGLTKDQFKRLQKCKLWEVQTGCTTRFKDEFGTATARKMLGCAEPSTCCKRLGLWKNSKDCHSKGGSVAGKGLGFFLVDDDGSKQCADCPEDVNRLCPKEKGRKLGGLKQFSRKLLSHAAQAMMIMKKKTRGTLLGESTGFGGIVDKVKSVGRKEEPKVKKKDGETCRENYECESDTCAGNLGGLKDGECGKSLVEQVKDTAKSVNPLKSGMVGLLKGLVPDKYHQSIEPVVENLLKGEMTKAVAQGTIAVTPKKYQPFLVPLVEKIAQLKITEAAKSLVTVFRPRKHPTDKTRAAKKAATVMFEDGKNTLLLALGINPCGAECQCDAFLSAILDRRYFITFTLHKAWDAYDKALQDVIWGLSDTRNRTGSWPKNQYYAQVSIDPESNKTPIDQVGARAKAVIRKYANMGLFSCVRKPGPEPDTPEDERDCIAGTMMPRFYLQKWLKSETELTPKDGLMCTVTIDYRIDLCSTCCCKYGMVTNNLNTALTGDSNVSALVG